MILAIDQGTTGSTALLFNQDGTLAGRGYQEFNQIYPQPGWVEHDPLEIWHVTRQATKQALAAAGMAADTIQAIGITNQRETTVLWDRTTGQPVHNAIVWQCRRSAELCDTIKAEGKADWIYQKTGLVVDAYFSGTKLQWLFQQHPDLLHRAEAGELCFGTIDSWLIWQLTGGKVHATDHTNASRTLLYNITSHDWDLELLDYLSIPAAILPTVQCSKSHFSNSQSNTFLGIEAPICGVAGDQQAALFGQQCTQPGMVKNTYGTGCFMLMYAGKERPISRNGLLTTLACDAEGQPAYALEGSVFIGGAGVQWLRDELGMIEHAADTEAIATAIDNTQGVYIVPAFTGLGAPYWDMQARGTIVGLTRGAGKNEIVRAMLEAIAYQSCELANAMAKDTGLGIDVVKVDGGAAANNFLMQFQADMLDAVVQRPTQVESTAMGAALLAGMGAGIWQSEQLPERLGQLDREFKPGMSAEQRTALYSGWQQAVSQTRT